MPISVFGNPDLPFDSLPLQIVPDLRELFLEQDFRIEDPEELDLPAEGADTWIIIDTVEGIEQVTEIPVERLVTAPRLTAHDFDLGSYLLLVRKLRPTLRVCIIGVPMQGDREVILAAVSTLLKKLTTNN
jgi:hypothetical protein